MFDLRPTILVHYTPFSSSGRSSLQMSSIHEKRLETQKANDASKILSNPCIIFSVPHKTFWIKTMRFWISLFLHVILTNGIKNGSQPFNHLQYQIPFPYCFPSLYSRMAGNFFANSLSHFN